MPGSCCPKAGAAPPRRAVALFFSVPRASWASDHIVVERDLLVQQADAVERKPARAVGRRGSIAVHGPRRLVQCFWTLGRSRHWTRSRSRISVARSRVSIPVSRARDKGPPLTSRYYVRSSPAGTSSQRRVRFRSGRFWRPECDGRRLLPRSLQFLFLPANTVRHIVGIFVGIGSHRR